MHPSGPTPLRLTVLAILAFGIVGEARGLVAQGRTPGGATPKDKKDKKDKHEKGNADKSSTELSRADRYFAICDYDANGWISYAEASASLGIDRNTWKAYDEDRDGRIIASEFKRRYEAILATGGAFLPPRAKADAKEAIPERADEALETYDKNGDGGLDQVELEVLLVQVGAVRMEAETSLEQFDRDLSRKLESAEIEDLLSLLKPSHTSSKGPRPRTIDELFGKIVPRKLQEGSTPQPMRVTPPVRSFRRLDIDANGVISLEDLAELQRPLVLPARTPAVLAALDTNGDGVLDESEFRASMRSAP
jgi:Ca2+-binding EF-hand superfamily protein